jgi:hypothetical protein
MTIMTDAASTEPKGPLFAKFTENNDWEGEVWNFYIPVAGNEEALKALRAKLDEWARDSGGCEYDLAEDYLTEAEVDTLVKHADTDGYYPDHQKLEGSLDLDAIHSSGDLYKGTIQDRMRK